MKVTYKNNTLETVLVVVKTVTSLVVVGTFVLLFGFYEPLVPIPIVVTVQIAMLFVFLAGKVIRLLNAQSKAEYLYANWYEIPMLLALAAVVFGAPRWFREIEPDRVRHLAIGVYLIFEVTIKTFLSSISLAATGRNPTKTLVGSFVVLIVVGAALLMLPRATAGRESLGLVDALFTSTSATCVTGLIVRNTGQDFTIMGQVVILVLIQLGALGIMVFGAVIVLLLGQAFSLRESVALQDLLSARTLGRIGNIIVFIFAATVTIEAIGALALFEMWDDIPSWNGQLHSRWFYSVFHSISAFCNAGFDLTGDSFVPYNHQWQVYGIVCPLIVLGGLGFSVLYNLAGVIADYTGLFLKRYLRRRSTLAIEPPMRMRLQSKIVLSATAVLIVTGTLALLFFERYAGFPGRGERLGVLGALFQSITARTAGFNTVSIHELNPSSKVVLILLMFVGGSPGSTAGGVKNVTLVVILLTVIAMLRKRGELEIFHRSIRKVVVDRAITVVLLFVTVLLTATLALSITEKPYVHGFSLLDLMFETASALGTVGLTTGVTPTLTVPGRFIIIAVMLIGRLGPLTLVAAMTFNVKPARYNYPDEPVVVG
jgi:trk system potassium uptake protein TrkH